MILDDGHDLTGVIIDKHPELIDGIIGLSEETTTGIHHILKRIEENTFPFRAFNVNDSVTKTKLK